MIPLFKVTMSNDAPAAVTKVLTSGYITQGPRVDEFENRLNEALKPNNYPILLNSCTSALDLAFELIGIGAGDEVISTPMTCFATNTGLINRGARIRWADVDKDTGLIDPDSVAALVNSNTKAIVAVNWMGRWPDYAKLKSHGIPVVEDAAHTWDVNLLVKPERGDYICYSLQAIKFLTAGDGGILIVPRGQEEEARKLRWYGLDRTKNENFRITQNITHSGFKYNMNDISAAIGMANMEQARRSVIANGYNAKTYAKYLSDSLPYDQKMSYWAFPILIENNLRDVFVEFMKKNEVEVGQVHHRNDLYDATARFKEGELPGLTKFANRQVNIPCGWWVGEQDVFYILDKIKTFKNEYN